MELYRYPSIGLSIQRLPKITFIFLIHVWPNKHDCDNGFPFLNVEHDIIIYSVSLPPLLHPVSRSAAKQPAAMKLFCSTLGRLNMYSNH